MEGKMQLQPSLSHYYYTKIGGLFVACLLLLVVGSNGNTSGKSLDFVRQYLRIWNGGASNDADR